MSLALNVFHKCEPINRTVKHLRNLNYSTKDVHIAKSVDFLKSQKISVTALTDKLPSRLL